MNTPISEEFLTDHRDTLPLAQRVEARRLLDSLTGEHYALPGPVSFNRLARIMEPGLRRTLAVAHA